MLETVESQQPFSFQSSRAFWRTFWRWMKTFDHQKIRMSMNRSRVVIMEQRETGYTNKQARERTRTLPFPNCPPSLAVQLQQRWAYSHPVGANPTLGFSYPYWHRNNFLFPVPNAYSKLRAEGKKEFPKGLPFEEYRDGLRLLTPDAGAGIRRRVSKRIEPPNRMNRHIRNDQLYGALSLG